MRRTKAKMLMAAVAAVAVIGCDLGSGPNGGNELDFDAAVVAADGTLEDLQMMHGPRMSLRGIVFPGLLGNKPNCPESDDIFFCPPIEREGLTYTRTITYMDATGTPQDGYDEVTTASIHYLISVEGELGRERWSATIDRERELLVTGLLNNDGVVTWNGTGSSSRQKSRHFGDGEARNYDVSSTSAIEDVVIPFPREDDSWPLSGVVTRNVSMTRTGADGTETNERVVTVEFNGTQIVPVTVGDTTFTVDLTERRFGPGKMGGHHGKK